MHQPFLAMIIPVGGGGSPPGTWGGSGQPFPTPPIHMPPGQGGPGSPPGTWGGSSEPFPGYGLPGQPPGTWGGSGQPFPEHPMAPGGRPPGTWGGSGTPFPTPPIVIPPQNPGEPPLVIWGPGDPRPMPPIELPGGGNPPPGGEQVKLIEWHTAWTPQTGWIVVGTPNVPHPAPSR